LPENTRDHRLNSRTVLMNAVFRFLYWNMNYHVEHHMFPMVPYHALPQLHASIGNDLPPPYRSIWIAYQEIVPALSRQRRDPAFHVRRPLPARQPS
jgi:fatty acid desaturase